MPSLPWEPARLLLHSCCALLLFLLSSGTKSAVETFNILISTTHFKFFSAKLKCLFALTVASSGLQLEVVLRKGQRLLDRGPYTGAWTEAALAPRAAAHRATPPSPAVTGRRRGRAAYDASSRRATSRSAARVECARKAAAPAAPATTASSLLSWACCCTATLSDPAARFAWSSAESPAAADQSMFCPFVTHATALVHITLGIEMPHRLRAPTFSASPSPAAAASSPRDRLYLEHGWALDAGSSHTRPCSLYIPSHR